MWWRVASRVVLAWGACAAALGARGLAADDGGPPAQAAGRDGRASGEVTYVFQGWADPLTRQFYHVPEGTFLMPYAWAKALAKQAGTPTLFEMVRGYGALEDPESQEGLPVGMVIDRRFDREWLGVTCALCHTGEIRSGGRRIRIVGGSSPVDYPALLAGLYGRLVGTAEDPGRFDAFTREVGGEGRGEELRNEVLALAGRARTSLAAIRNEEVVPTPHGPYRLDALGLGAINTGIAYPDQVKRQATAAKPTIPRANAPVSYPSLWHGPWRDSAQYCVAIHSPLPRNLIQAFATSFVPGPAPLPHRNLDFPGLIAIEEWLRDLTPPAWPEETLGRVDRDRAGRGRELFRRHCLECHNWKTTLPTPEGISFLRTVETPLAVMRTDPVQYDNFKGANSRMLLLQNISNQLMGAYFAEANLPPEDRIRATFGKDNIWRVRAGYGATPLDGVWATAPYLHNGSVPTLYDLLLPPDRRPKSFRLGALAFDPKKVGLASEGDFTFDTTRPGNSNSGHEYGTGLADDDRWALVEYLKVIRPWRWDDR